jgi:regulator of RNase E activity RraA
MDRSKVVGSERVAVPPSLDSLRLADSPSIANAIERFDVRDRTDGFVGGSIRCMLPELGTMVGRAIAVTMSSRPGPVASRIGDWRMWEALERAPSPSILVLQDVSGTPSRCAYFGEVMSTLAGRLSCVGFVTDGGVRDLSEIETLGFHLFATRAVVFHGATFGVGAGAPHQPHRALPSSVQPDGRKIALDGSSRPRRVAQRVSGKRRRLESRLGRDPAFVDEEAAICDWARIEISAQAVSQKGGVYSASIPPVKLSKMGLTYRRSRSIG